MHDKTQKEHSYDTVTPNTACRTPPKIFFCLVLISAHCQFATALNAIATVQVRGLPKSEFCPGLLDWWLFFNHIWAKKANFNYFIVKLTVVAQHNGNIPVVTIYILCTSLISGIHSFIMKILGTQIFWVYSTQAKNADFTSKYTNQIFFQYIE
jgi:hypothetical protein